MGGRFLIKYLDASNCDEQNEAASSRRQASALRFSPPPTLYLSQEEIPNFPAPEAAAPITISQPYYDLRISPNLGLTFLIFDGVVEKSSIVLRYCPSWPHLCRHPASPQQISSTPVPAVWSTNRCFLGRRTWLGTRPGGQVPFSSDGPPARLQTEVRSAFLSRGTTGLQQDRTHELGSPISFSRGLFPEASQYFQRYVFCLPQSSRVLEPTLPSPGWLNNFPIVRSYRDAVKSCRTLQETTCNILLQCYLT